MPPRSTTILVDVIANNPRSRNTLEFAIGRHGKGKMDVGHGTDAHLAVVDCDGHQAKIALQQYYLRYPQRPVVLLLSSETEYGNYVDSTMALQAEVVIKPVKLDNMIEAIERGANKANTPVQAPTASTALVPAATELVDVFEKTVALPGGFGGMMAAERSDGEKNSTTLTALERLQQRIGSFLDPMAPAPHAAGDIDLNDAAATELHRLRAGKLLLGHLKDALQKNSITNVPLIGYHQEQALFRWLPERKCFELLIDENALLSLATQEIQEEQFSLQADQTTPPAVTRIFSREGFLWRLALLTYRGMIPEETNPNERVYLLHWPNMTRLDPVPDGLRIAALWNRMPVDLAYTARVLRIPQRHVFLFYAAASTIGLAGPARRASNYLFEPDLQQEIMPHTILSRLAGHFADGARPLDDKAEETS